MTKIDLPACPICHTEQPAWKFSVLSNDSRFYRLGSRGGVRPAGASRGVESDDVEDIRAVCSSCGNEFFWGDNPALDALIETFRDHHQFYG